MRRLKEMLSVFIFGSLGAFCRYCLLALQCQDILFPYMILIINLLASFCIGILYFKLNSLKEKCRYLYIGILVGFFASFSTISELIADTYSLYLNQHMFLCILNLASNVIGGILFCSLATRIAHKNPS